MIKEEGIFLTKIEFNLGDCWLFLILQPKLLPRVIEVLRLIEKMPYTDYILFLRTPDGFEWSRLRNQLWPFLIENGDIQNGENWEIFFSIFPPFSEQNQNTFFKRYEIAKRISLSCTLFFTLKS